MRKSNKWLLFLPFFIIACNHPEFSRSFDKTGSFESGRIKPGTEIQLPGGETFKVIARNCPEKNKYIQSATLNGKELNRPFIHHTDIVQGGKLYLVMGEKPNKTWGTEY
jgi:hypothetical protein